MGIRGGPLHPAHASAPSREQVEQTPTDRQPWPCTLGLSAYIAQAPQQPGDMLLEAARLAHLPVQRRKHKRAAGECCHALDIDCGTAGWRAEAAGPADGGPCRGCGTPAWKECGQQLAVAVPSAIQPGAIATGLHAAALGQLHVGASFPPAGSRGRVSSLT